MKIKRKGMAVSLVLILGLLAGCGNQSTEKEEWTPSDSQVTMTLEETEYEIPEEIAAINNIVQKEDGTVYLSVCEDGYRDGSIWELKDEGSEWEMQYRYTDDLPEEIKQDKENYEIFGYLSPEGVVICKLYDVRDRTTKIYKIEDKVCEELYIDIPKEGVDETLSNIIDYIRFSENGDLVVSDILQIFIADVDTGEIRTTIGERDYSYSWVDCYATSDSVYVLTKSGIDCYDLETGVKLEMDEDLERFNKEFQKMFEEYRNTDEFFNYLSQRILVDDGSENRKIVLMNPNGLYQYQDGKLKQAAVADPALLEDGTTIDSMAWTGDENFLASVNPVDQDCSLVEYAPAETTYQVDTELTFYTLQENSSMKQVIAAYQKANPNVKIEVEVGMTGEGGGTVSDAANRLNTTMLAGDGPDLILMDGLAVEDYIEKNMLADLTETIGSVSRESELFENVASTYQTENGIFAVPGRFAMMFAADGEEDITDMDIEDGSKLLGNGGKYNGYAFSSMATVLYRTCLTEQEELTAESIRQFYEKLKLLYGQCGNEWEEAFGVDGYQTLSSQTLQVEDMQDAAYVYGGSTKAIGYLLETADYQILNNCQGQPVSYQMFTSGGELLYVPLSVLGVSSCSKNKEAALAFLEYYLSSEGQSNDSGTGISVNKSCVEDELGKTEELQMIINATQEKETQLVFDPLSEGQKEELMTLLSGASKAADTDETVFDIIKEHAVNYLSGDSNLETAAEDAYQKISLYLAE